MGQGRESRTMADNSGLAKRTSAKNKPIPTLRTPLAIMRPNRSDSFGSSSASSPVSSAGSSPSGSGSMSYFMNMMRPGSSSRMTSPSSSKFSHFSSFLLRRKPSRIDVAMCEERERCCEDEIERRGLALMEPRPIDLEPTYFANGSQSTLASSSMENFDPAVNIDAMLDTEPRSFNFNSQRHFAKLPRSPPYVMGGIFETMEGDR